MFEVALSKFYESICVKIEDFIFLKKNIMSKLKRLLLQKSLESILLDMERLPDCEREEFLKNHETMIQTAMQEPEFINFQLFDLDAMIDTQKTLTSFLWNRD